jgi:hypothetical protein
MTPEDIRTSYAELTRILTASGLEWVVEQVRQAVEAGFQVERFTRIFREEEGESMPPLFLDQQIGARRAGQPTAMMTLQPWPARDQLLFLIDGVRHAIVQAADIENEQFLLLRGVPGFVVEGIAVESEAEVGDQLPLRLTGIRSEPIQTLRRLLDELEQEVRT